MDLLLLFILVIFFLPHREFISIPWSVTLVSYGLYC